MMFTHRVKKIVIGLLFILYTVWIGAFAHVHTPQEKHEHCSTCDFIAVFQHTNTANAQPVLLYHALWVYVAASVIVFFTLSLTSNPVSRAPPHLLNA